MKGENYGWEYFERRKSSYHASAISSFALQVLGWAEKAGFPRLLNGKGKRALDIGCAQGYVVEALRGRGYESYGLDISPILSGRLGFSAFQASWTHLPFQDEAFDLVTSFEVAEHLPSEEALIQALREAFRVLKVGGSLIITTPALNPLNLLSDRLHREEHYVLRTAGWWKQTLTRFTGRVHIKTFNFIPMVRFPVRGRFLSAYAPRPLARHLAVFAAKEN